MSHWPQPPHAIMQPEPSNSFTLRMVQAPIEGRTLPRHQRLKGHTWPVDPPPVLELVSAEQDSEEWFYIHNPNWFCLAELICLDGTDSLHKFKKDDGTEKEVGVAGSWSSSLHKVRGSPDPNDKKEHGYFVFGDINVKTIGQYQLKFTLFEMRRHDGQIYASRLHSISSGPFMVRAQKTESVASTRFSRLLSEAGVKVKLRAESSNKRRGPKADWSSKQSDSMTRQLQLAPMQGPFLTTPPQEQPRGRHNMGVDVVDRVTTEHAPLSAMGSNPVTPFGNNHHPFMMTRGTPLPTPPQFQSQQTWNYSMPLPSHTVTPHFGQIATTTESVQYSAPMALPSEYLHTQLNLTMRPPRPLISNDSNYAAGSDFWYQQPQQHQHYQTQQQQPQQSQQQQYQEQLHQQFQHHLPQTPSQPPYTPY